MIAQTRNRTEIQAFLKEVQSNYLADGSKNVYNYNLKRFLDWVGSDEPNEDDLFLYLVGLAKEGKSVATLKTVYYSIKKEVEVNNPAKFQRFIYAVRNTYAKKGRFSSGARALPKKVLLKMIDKVRSGKSNDITKKRNIALLLTLYYGAFRVSELINLKISDVHFVRNRGIRIRIDSSKTDKEKTGFYKALFYKNPSYCPVLALRDWLEIVNEKTGFVFRSVNKYGGISKRSLDRQAVHSLIKSLNKKYSCHSFRSGFVTNAAEQGSSFMEIMAQTNHKSLQMVAHYCRPVEIFVNNAAKKL